ncbi:MAG: branched-chain amino acid transaminase, partial [Candidatus Promineifilaceae bacterium]
MNSAKTVGANGQQTGPRQPARHGSRIMQAEYIWLDGEFVPFDRATVHFLSPSLHYGMGVFEGIRCYATERGTAAFRLREHLRRFLDSIRILGIDQLLLEVDTLRDVVCRLIRVNNLNACYVRPMMYFEGPPELILDAYRPVVGVAAWLWPDFLGHDARKHGTRMMISSISRAHPNAGMVRAKVSGQYVNSILAKTMAARAGFDDAILLDSEGYVSGCTGENLYLVRDGVIYSPPRDTILEGVTGESVLMLARDAGYRVIEERISRDQLFTADEVLACGTAAQVVGVRQIDYRTIGKGRPG